MKLNESSDSLTSGLAEIATQTGRATDELMQDAMAANFEELAEACGMLDRRYDDIRSGKMKPINGGSYFEGLLQRTA